MSERQPLERLKALPAPHPRPSVSIIVPVHNAERYLEETLASLIQQSWPPLEIIAVDDASTDGSGEILARVARDAAVPVRVITNTTPEGVARARNQGAYEAKGQWLAFTDNDDLWHTRLLELTLDLLVDTPDALALGADALGFALEADRADLGRHQRERMVTVWVSDDPQAVLERYAGDVESAPLRFPTLQDFRRETVFATTQVLFRRDAFARAGGFASWCHRADDWPLNGTLAAMAPIPTKNAPLVFYRVRSSSQSHALAESHLPLLTANLALRFGGADPDREASGDLYKHLVLSLVTAGGSFRRAVGFALVGGGFSWRDYRALVRARIRRTRRSKP